MQDHGPHLRDTGVYAIGAVGVIFGALSMLVFMFATT